MKFKSLTKRKNDNNDKIVFKPKAVKKDKNIIVKPKKEVFVKKCGKVVKDFVHVNEIYDYSEIKSNFYEFSFLREIKSNKDLFNLLISENEIGDFGLKFNVESIRISGGNLQAVLIDGEDKYMVKIKQRYLSTPDVVITNMKTKQKL